MINICRAKVEEESILSNIAINSEAYWGYSEEYMKSYKNTYGVSENYIKEE
ncbi:hypothetical protein [uncultured Clostridium sp.]|uniref:hypothetical protein n=1 Tax=uncultured Clostridium sp. TaxID=59620 RepID=UPI0032164165